MFRFFRVPSPAGIEIILGAAGIDSLGEAVERVHIGRSAHVDFFVFADNFGKEGPPEPADTIVVEQKEPILLGQFKTGPYWLFGMAATMGR